MITCHMTSQYLLTNDFQAEKWGEDAEAAAHAARLFEEFKHAALFLAFHRTS